MNTPTRHPRRRGDAARQRIVAALLERKEQGLPNPTLDELNPLVKGSLTNLRHHLTWLEEQGLIRIEDALREVTRREVVLIDPRKKVQP